MMTEQEIAARAVIETLRYLAWTDPPDHAPDLREWADHVEAIAAHGDGACCPFCSEVECDDHCPLRHWRHADTPGA